MTDIKKDAILSDMPKQQVESLLSKVGIVKQDFVLNVKEKRRLDIDINKSALIVIRNGSSTSQIGIAASQGEIVTELLKSNQYTIGEVGEDSISIIKEPDGFYIVENKKWNRASLIHLMVISL